jgi:Protein tyrosine and serine/threonine kinase
MAPECFHGVSDLGNDQLKAVDIYAFGVLMYELLVGHSPWILERVTSQLTLQRYVCFDQKRPGWGSRSSSICLEYKRLVEKCWHQDSKRRPTSKELVFIIREMYRQRCDTQGNGSSGYSTAADSTVSGPPSSANAPSSGSWPVGTKPNSSEPVASGVSLQHDGVPSHNISHVNETSNVVDGYAQVGPAHESPPNGYYKGSYRHSANSNPMASSVTSSTDDCSGSGGPGEPPAAASYNSQRTALQQQHHGRINTPVCVGQAAPNPTFGRPAPYNDIQYSHSAGAMVRRVKTEMVVRPPVPSLDLFDAGPGIPFAGGGRNVNPMPNSGNAPDPQRQGILGGDSMLAAVQNQNVPSQVAVADAQDLKPGAGNMPQVTGAPTAPVDGMQDLINKFERANAHSGSIPQLSSSMSNVPAAGSKQGSTDQLQPAYDQRASSAPEPGALLTGPRVPARGAGIDAGAVITALQAQHGLSQVHAWWDDGHGPLIANALSRSDARSGGQVRPILIKDLLIKASNGPAKNPTIAKDLCVALGNVARSGLIDNVWAQQLLPVTLAAMQAFSFDVNVYSAACYALANILKVSNEIPDDRRRREVADWVSHAMSFNLNGAGQPRVPSLAYLTASAARNFVWRREKNAQAFFLRREGVKWSAAENMRASMIFFKQDSTVVESCLSAFAALSFFPSLQVSLVRIRIVSAVSQVVDPPIVSNGSTAGNSGTAVLSMGLTTIGILVGGRTPPERLLPSEMQTISAALISEGGVSCVITAVENAMRNKSVPVIESGLHTLAALAQFDGRLLEECVQQGAVGPVVQAVWFAVRGGPQDVSARMAEVICESVLGLSSHPAAASAMRGARLADPMTTLVTRFNNIPRVVSLGNEAICRVR